jgi:hypothetical protein
VCRRLFLGPSTPELFAIRQQLMARLRRINGPQRETFGQSIVTTCSFSPTCQGDRSGLFPKIGPRYLTSPSVTSPRSDRAHWLSYHFADLPSPSRRRPLNPLPYVIQAPSISSPASTGTAERTNRKPRFLRKSSRPASSTHGMELSGAGTGPTTCLFWHYLMAELLPRARL